MRFHDLLLDQTIRYRSVAAACQTSHRDLRRDVKTEHAEIVRAAVARDADAGPPPRSSGTNATADLLVTGQDETARDDRSG